MSHCEPKYFALDVFLTIYYQLSLHCMANLDELASSISQRFCLRTKLPFAYL